MTHRLVDDVYLESMRGHPDAHTFSFVRVRGATDRAAGTRFRKREGSDMTGRGWRARDDDPTAQASAEGRSRTNSTSSSSSSPSSCSVTVLSSCTELSSWTRMGSTGAPSGALPSSCGSTTSMILRGAVGSTNCAHCSMRTWSSLTSTCLDSMRMSLTVFTSPVRLRTRLKSARSGIGIQPRESIYTGVSNDIYEVKPPHVHDS